MAAVVIRKGDWVRLGVDSHDLDALVIMASSNGRSLIVVCEAIVGGFVGTVPVFQEDDGRWTTLSGTPITVRPKADL